MRSTKFVPFSSRVERIDDVVEASIWNDGFMGNAAGVCFGEKSNAPPSTD